MDDLAKRRDPVMIERFKTFPEGGAERKLLTDWLSGPSKAANKWMIHVAMAKSYLRTMQENMQFPLSAKDMVVVKDLLGIRDDIREYFSSEDIEPEVLKTLFGDSIDYDVKPCPEDSLIDLLNEKPINILIGMCHLSKVAHQNYDSISPLQSLTNEEMAARLDHFFKQKYAGPGVRWLTEALPLYMKMYDGRIHYGKTIVILQSSGTGKSRTVAEMANSPDHWGISVCFRGLGSPKIPDAGDGYPLGDRSVFGCLDMLPKDVIHEFKFVKSEEIAAAFMGALFDVVHDTIISSNGHKEDFDKIWDISDANQENAPRFKNFEKVRTNAIGLLKANAKQILDARNLAPTVLMEPSPQTPSVAHNNMEVDNKSGSADSASPDDIDMKTADVDMKTADVDEKTDPPEFKSSQWTKKWVARLFSILVKKSAGDLNDDRRKLKLSCFTFTFDESSQMNFDYKPVPNEKPPDNRITLLAMQRAIKACDQYHFWFPMPDTTSGLADVYPTANKKTALSFRLQGTLRPLPPWIYMPFNVMVPSSEKLPQIPLEALRLDRLRVYGRPLWSTYEDNELMRLAQKKLLCDDPEDFPKDKDDGKRNLQILALHSTRFVLNLTAEGAANQMALDSVKSHLRVLTDYDASTLVLESEVPSEPILAIAAGDLLLKSKKTYKDAMDILVEKLLLSLKVISLGENGETCGRIILIVNRDVTVHAAGGQLCVVDAVKHKIVEQEYDQDGHMLYAVRPFTLESYLRQLVDEAKVDQVDGAYDSGLKWASEVHMNFTHFVQLKNLIESEVSYEFVLSCWRKGLALQCVHDQPVIDNLLIGYRGDLSERFDPKMFVFVAVQIKNRASAAKLTLINTITCPFIKFESKRWKPEYMAILMDLGTSTDFKSTNERVQATHCKAVEGQAWSAFVEAKEYLAVRINIRGLRPYFSVHEWAPNFLKLQSGKGLTDFASFNEDFELTRDPNKDALTWSRKKTLARHKKLFKGV